MKKFFWSSTRWYLAVVLFLFLCLPIFFLIKWFGGNTIIYFWDGLFPLDSKNNLFHFYYLWKGSVFPGGFDPGWSWLLYIVGVYLLEDVTHSLFMAQAVLYWFLLFFSLLNFYLLGEYLLKPYFFSNLLKRLIPAAGAVLYTFNIYVFYYSFRIFNPQEYILSFLPLNFLCLLNLFPLSEAGSSGATGWRRVVYLLLFFFSLLLMVPGFSSIIFFAEYLIILFLYLCFYALLQPKRLEKVINVIFFYILIILSNLWWIFPMVLASRSVYAVSAAIGTDIYFVLNSKLSVLSNALRLIGMPPQQNPIFSWEGIYSADSIYAFALFIFPAVIVLLVAFIRKVALRAFVIFSLGMFLLFLYLVKEANPPISFIMQFAFVHIPFFGVYRDAYHKAGLYYVFFYFLLVTCGAGFLLSKWKSIIMRLILGILLVIGAIVMVTPFFFVDNTPRLIIDRTVNPPKTFSAMIQIPSEYFALKSELEPICDGTQVLVLPKTAILSSAFWPKTNFSYVGQDLLHNIINCNFIVSQTSNPAADVYYSIPYMYLQQDDLNGFKKFLSASGTYIVLVRKDYLPNGYTDAISINSSDVISRLNLDSDLVKLSENDLFAVYRFSSFQNNRYGFSLPQKLVVSNLDITSSSDVKTYFDFLDNPDAVFSGSISGASSEIYNNVVFGKCIGCEYLPGLSDKAVVLLPDKTILQQFSGGIKQLTSGKANSSLDEQMFSMDNTFQSWLAAKRTNNIHLSEYADNYRSILSNVFTALRTGLLDSFQKDYNYIKFRNFLHQEDSVLKQYVHDNQYDFDAIQMYYLQQYYLSYLNNIIWETDFDKQLFRYRLDIPESAWYQCRAVSSDPEINANSFTIYNQKAQSLASTEYLAKGSYKAEVPYSIGSVVDGEYSISGNSFYVRKIDLHNLSQNGYYKLSLQTDILASSPITVVISTKDMAKFTPDKITDGYYNAIAYKNRSDPLEYQDGVVGYFYSGGDPKANYYLYLISEEGKPNNPAFNMHVLLTPIPNINTIHLVCDQSGKDLLAAADLDVKKRNQYTYEITLSSNATNRVLAFNQSFNAYWNAYSIIDGKKHYYQHSVVNGYANSWFIDKVGDGKVYVEFSAQKLSERVAIGTGAVFIIMLIGYVVYSKNKYGK